MQKKNIESPDEVEVFIDPESGEEIVVIDEEGAADYIEEKPAKEKNFEKECAKIAEDYEDDDDEEEGFSSGLANKLLFGFGGIVVLVALIVLITFGVKKLGTKASQAQIDSFDGVGTKLQEIGVIGQFGLGSIISEEGTRLNDITEAIKNYEYDEVDEVTGVINVSVTCTSILKDMKIKFVNSKNKLIGSVPFEIEVTDPSGNASNYKDDDKDGIIYLDGLGAGNYKVKLLELYGYTDLYDFGAVAQSVAIKTELDYKKVDVKNEIKTESQVNAATEDTKETDTEVESALKDTVNYVISSKTAAGNEYIAVDKATTIIDPMKTLAATYDVASLGRFARLSAGPSNMEGEKTITIPATLELTAGGEAGTVTATVTGLTAEEHATYAWEVSEGAGVVTLSNETTETVTVTPASAAGTAKIRCTVTTEVETTGITSLECVITVAEATPPTPPPASYTLDASPADTTKVLNGGEAYTLTVTTGDYTGDLTWEVTGDTTALTAGTTGTSSARSNTFTAAALAAGSGDKVATVTVSYTDANSVLHTFSCAITVKAPLAPTMTITADTTVKAGAVVDIAVVPSNMTGYTYTWTSSDVNVVKVEEGATASGADIKTCKFATLAKGTVTITCKATKAGATDIVKTMTLNVTEPDLAINLGASLRTIFLNGEVVQLVPTYTNAQTTKKVKWTSKDEAVVKVDQNGILTPVAEGITNVVATSLEVPAVTKEITIKVMKHPSGDTTTKLLDKDGTQIYVYDMTSKAYREATYADYYKETVFYKMGDITYTYKGWQTFGGKTYYYDDKGNKVTGEQVILGAKYNFGNDGALVSGTGSFGIDVSKFNGSIDWNSVAKSGVSYAILRCGYRGSTVGSLVEDVKFAYNAKSATSAGIKIGVYFFTQAINEVEAVEEASMVLDMIADYDVKYPVFIDVEPATGGRANNLSVDERTAVIKAFCQTITNGGYTAGIYANKTWLTNKINTSELTAYKIWLAQYASAPTYTATRYDMWQYSSTGEISGITGNVDLDLSYIGK